MIGVRLVRQGDGVRRAVQRDRARIIVPRLIEGRLPEAADECVVETNTRTPEYFRPGCEITLSLNDGEKELSDSLKRDTFKIVGIVQSPLYISFNRGSTNIGNGNIDAFCLIPKETFAYSAYTDVYITLSKDEDYIDEDDE